MALFIGWSRDQMELALKLANVHFGDNLYFNALLEVNQKDDRYRATLKVLNGTRLKKKDLAKYPETLRNFEDRKELLPDYLYPYGASVRWGIGDEKPRGAKKHACWHAHGQFYRELFKLNPKGQIRSAIANYNTETGFDDAYPRTECRNIGSEMYPQAMADACCCDDHDIGTGWL